MSNDCELFCCVVIGKAEKWNSHALVSNNVVIWGMNGNHLFSWLFWGCVEIIYLWCVRPITTLQYNVPSNALTAFFILLRRQLLASDQNTATTVMRNPARTSHYNNVPQMLHSVRAPDLPPTSFWFEIVHHRAISGICIVNNHMSRCHMWIKR
jgi:hypothetical protein